MVGSSTTDGYPSHVLNAPVKDVVEGLSRVLAEYGLEDDDEDNILKRFEQELRQLVKKPQNSNIESEISIKAQDPQPEAFRVKDPPDYDRNKECFSIAHMGGLVIDELKSLRKFISQIQGRFAETNTNDEEFKKTESLAVLHEIENFASICDGKLEELFSCSGVRPVDKHVDGKLFSELGKTSTGLLRLPALRRSSDGDIKPWLYSSIGESSFQGVSLSGRICPYNEGNEKSERQLNNAVQNKEAFINNGLPGFGVNSTPSQFLNKINAHTLDSLDQFDIEMAPPNQTNRVGFHLLMCDNTSCTLQEIDTGLIHLPHLTKILTKCKWIYAPKTVLIIKKPFEVECTNAMVELAELFVSEGLRVVVEDSSTDPLPSSGATLRQRSLLRKLQSMTGVQSAAPDAIRELPIDFCVCIGGDGTIIWLSHLFPTGCPPTISVAMGSLGFLSTFERESMCKALKKFLTCEATMTLRSRLEAKVIRKGESENDEDIKTFTVLNEVTIDRGQLNTIVNLDLYIGSKRSPVTHVQGDGIIIATPTGSTAYSLSAGGSIVHPSIPCMLITPICPHSLSFRPIIVSDTSTVCLKVSESARSSALVSFDGRCPVELHKGDAISIRVSQFPVPCICAEGENEDWFRAIKSSFLWNERIVQNLSSSTE